MFVGIDGQICEGGFRCAIAYTAGNSSNVSAVAVISPPMTTVASGR
jgi:hypothetical protein